jgi:hypothetical protein
MIRRNASRRAGGHGSWASISAQSGNQTRLSSLSWLIFDCSRKKQTQFVFNRPGRKLKSPLATHTPSIRTRRKNRENFVDATAPNCQTAFVKSVEQSFVFGHPTLSQYYCWAAWCESPLFDIRLIEVK